MKCVVAIDTALPEWILILQQIGVQWIVSDMQESISVENTPVLILTSQLTNNHVKSRIFSFLKSGGSVMTTASHAASLFELPKKKIRIQYLLPDNQLLLYELADVGRMDNISKSSNHLSNQNNQQCIQITEYLNGKLVILPDGLVKNITGWKYARKNFYSVGGQRYPSEIVSSVNKGAIRRIIQNALSLLFHHHHIPFIHLSDTPVQSKPLFIFRIDTDYSTAKQIETLYYILEKYHLRATWFIETKTQGTLLNTYQQFFNHELAYHCYRHRTFRLDAFNTRDFNSGLNILHQRQIDPKGYAAPQGIWTPVLARAIERYGFEYSSEFGHGYDDLPYFPYMNHRFMSALQIPVHPVSTGRLSNAGYADQEMIHYYMNRFNFQLSINEPVLFYHHPAHERFSVFDEIFSTVNDLSMVNMTMLEYARWWKNRNSVLWLASHERNIISVQTDNTGENVSLELIYPDQQIFHIPLKSTSYSFDSLQTYRIKLHDRPFLTPTQDELRRLRCFDKRLIHQNLLFHYRRMKQ